MEAAEELQPLSSPAASASLLISSQASSSSAGCARFEQQISPNRSHASQHSKIAEPLGQLARFLEQRIRPLELVAGTEHKGKLRKELGTQGRLGGTEGL